VVIFGFMSSTLAMAKSVDESTDNSPKDPVITQSVSAELVSQVIIDGPDLVTPTPFGSACPQWYDLAMRFFPPAEWDTIDFLLYRESRCDLQALNPKDTNGKPSYSLFQINAFWCRPSKHYEQGFLQHQGVLTTCDELFEPETQFRAAQAIYVEGLVRHGRGWRSWGSYPETR
jgi:hypothetical protein